MTKWKKITTKAGYKKAIDRINTLMDVERTDAVYNELSLLSFVVKDYEEEFHPMPDASPLEVIRFAMEMKGIKQQDLIPVLGTKGNVSKILNGKANIQLKDLHPLSMLLGIPLDSLVPKNNAYDSSMGIMAELVAEPSGVVHKENVATAKPRGKPYRRKSQTNLGAAAKKKSNQKNREKFS